MAAQSLARIRNCSRGALVGLCLASLASASGPTQWNRHAEHHDGASFGTGEWNRHAEHHDGASFGAGGCQSACAMLQHVMPSSVAEPNTTAYSSEQMRYWSAIQAETEPRCFVQPTCAEEVAHIVLLSQRTNCPFAVKSGGHAAYAGASSIEDGITIDLRLLNEVTVSEDQTTTRVGAGNRWIDVYENLTPMNLSVIGGRVAEIGVGGLTLGGGISFFSGLHGWACDNVRNYEVVTANGTVLDVNYTSYPDLYYALRGGGNNFGIVTRFDLETFAQGSFWGGHVDYSAAYNASLISALVDFGTNAPQAPDAMVYLAFVWIKSYDAWIADAELTYAKPVADPPIFQNFTAVPNITGTSTLRISNMTDLAKELNQSNPNGLRETYWTLTFKNDPRILQAALDIFVEEVEPLKNVSDILPAFILQPIALNVIQYFSKSGGNCLGIELEDGPLQLLNLATRWSDPSADAQVLSAHQRMVDRMQQKAEELDAQSRYIYQNYAARGQEVFASYGEANRERLVEISKKYDPERVFETLQPGYFKL